MKTVMQLLSLVLCFEFIIGPVSGVSFVESAKAEEKKTCTAPLVLNEDLNRCVTKDEVVNTNNKIDQCRNRPDEASRRKCYEENAQNAFNDSKDPRHKDRNHSYMTDNGGMTTAGAMSSAAVVAIPLLLLTKNLADKKKSGGMFCKPASLMLMYAGGAAVLVGEVVSYIQHRRNLNKMDKRRQEIMVAENGKTSDANKAIATNAQSESFELLAQNEDSIAKIAKTKYISYLTATGLFAAGATMAIIEKVQLAKAEIPDQNGNKDYATIQRLTCQDQSAKKKVQDEANKERLAQENKNKPADGKPTDGKAANNNQGSTNSNGGKIYEGHREVEYNSDGSIKRESQDFRIYENGSGANESTSGSTNNTTTTGTTPSTKTGSGLGGVTSVIPTLVSAAGGALNKSGQNSGTNSPGSTTGTPGYDPIPGLQCQSDELKIDGICVSAKDYNGCNDSGGEWNSSNKACVCAEGTVWSVFESKCKKGTASIESLLNQKYKVAAIKNIANAENLADVQELMAEIDSLEFENYSRTSYYGSELKADLKDIPFTSEMAQLVSGVLLEKAYAEDSQLNEVVVTGKRDPNYQPPTASALKPLPVDIQQPEMKTLEVPPLDQMIKLSSDGPNKNLFQKASDQVGKLMSKAIYQPMGRLATNALLGGWMGIMSAHMIKQEKISKERAELLRQMKIDLVDTNALTQCKEEDRNNSSKPTCYCFTAEGKKNPNRSKSKVCDTAYAGFNPNGPSTTTTADTKVCVDESGTMDSSCSCRQRKSKDGKSNACLKSTAGFSMNGINPGTFKMLSAAGGPANDVFNGNSSLGSMDPASLGVNAARIKKTADAAIAKDPAATKLAKDLENSLLATTRGINMGGPGMSSGSSPLPSSPQAAAAALDKELEKSKDDDVEVTKAGGGGGVVAPGKGEEQPEFGMTDEQFAAQETEVAEVLNNENIDFGGNDINNSSNTNIFDVLSNRYQRSGMRRLFDEEGKTQADKPAQTDIAP